MTALSGVGDVWGSEHAIPQCMQMIKVIARNPFNSKKRVEMHCLRLVVKGMPISLILLAGLITAQLHLKYNSTMRKLNTFMIDIFLNRLPSAPLGSVQLLTRL